MKRPYYTFDYNEVGQGNIIIKNDNLSVLFEFPAHITLQKKIDPGLWFIKGNPLYTSEDKRFAYLWSGREIPDAIISSRMNFFENYAMIIIERNDNVFFEWLDNYLKKYEIIEFYVNTEVPEGVLNGDHEKNLELAKREENHIGNDFLDV